MHMAKYFFLSICCVLTLSSVTAQNRPTGLLTDLLKYTDKVYINGYISTLPLWEIDKAIEPVRYAPIRSSFPSFSWIVPGTENGVVQTQYRIIVSDSLPSIQAGEGCIWDSGLVESDQSASVLYKGEALTPDKTYYWRVKSYTNTSGESEWSEIKAFRTANELDVYASSQEILVKTAEYPETINSVSTNIQVVDYGKASFGQLLVRLTSNSDADTVYVNMGEILSGDRVNIHSQQDGSTVRNQQFTLPLAKGTHTYRIKINPDRRNTNIDAGAILMPDYIGEVMPFRYAEIVGYDKKLSSADIIRETVTYPFDDNGAYFKSDNEILNGVWDLCHYSIKATSFTGTYIDGDRERIPYEGDAIINQLGHYSVDREYSMARHSFECLLDRPTWPTEWILQSAIIAWNDYIYTGDSRSLAANYEILKNRTLISLIEDNGLISTTTGLQTPQFSESIRFNGKIKDIVDWPNHKGGEADDFVFTDYNAVVNAFHYEAVNILANIADIVGEKDDAVFFKKRTTTLKNDFNKVFLDTKRGIYNDGDTTNHAALHSNMFALDFGLTPQKHQSSVLDHIISKGMACSVYGSQFLLDALYDGGKGDAALQLMTATHDRSWYNMLKVGSTISLEAWDNKYKRNQDWNHAWGAAPANVIPRRLVGVTATSAGCATVDIRPQIGDLKFVESLMPTIRGDIKVSITNSDKYTLKITLPANMGGKVYLPLLNKKQKVYLNGEKIDTVREANTSFVYAGNISSGTYEFIID